MLKIAITGNIASGKSEVEKYLKTKGYKVFDTDIIAHDKLLVLERQVIEMFKYDDIISQNKIDRKKLANVVFSNKKKLKILENILHPEIKNEILNIFETYKDEKFIFVSVPLLFETGFNTIFDKIIFVSANSNTRLQRLMARNALTEKEALKRIQTQQNENEKIKKCDFVIINESSVENLITQIEDLISNIH